MNYRKVQTQCFLNNLDFYFEENLNGLTLNYVIQPLKFYFYHRIDPNTNICFKDTIFLVTRL